ncbi:MAG TPA: MGMT family protein [Bacteroidia bacterium]|nr:MGMT family protein [Bacteroidia bacterium]
MAASDNKLDSFFEQVYAVARLIPKGRVTSYGAIAKYLGTAKSSRMVGWAMNNAHTVRPKIPAHRVVNRIGLLTGKHHFGSPDRMKELLEKEGIKVKKDQVVNFKSHFWDPILELELD